MCIHKGVLRNHTTIAPSIQPFVSARESRSAKNMKGGRTVTANASMDTILAILFMAGLPHAPIAFTCIR